MTLSKREKTLAGMVGAMAAGLLLWLGFGLFSGPLDTVRSQIAVQTDRLEKLQDQVLRAKKAQDQMSQWNRQALPCDVSKPGPLVPSDASRAGSLYQNWLLELAGKAGFRQKKVEPGEIRNRGDSALQLPFTVRGQASLEQLVKFLYDFYSAGHLHQIRRLTLRPVEKTKDLDVMIMVEALSLATADRKEQLSEVPSKRLALASFEDYRKAIVDRNVMSPPRPPVIAKPAAKPVEEVPSEPFDASKFAYVTGIVEVSGEAQVWVKARTTDEKFQLRKGDKFQMGPFSATIARINSRDVEIDIDGKRQTIPLGSSVRGGDAEKAAAESKGPKPEGRGPGAGPEGPKSGPGGPGSREGAGPTARGPDSEGKGPGPEGGGSRRDRRKMREEALQRQASGK